MTHAHRPDINRGGMLDLDGLLFANRCTWWHARAAEEVPGRDVPEWLNMDKCMAIDDRGESTVLRHGSTG